MSASISQALSTGHPERIDTNVPANSDSTPAEDPRSPPLPSSPRLLQPTDTPIETLLIDNFDSFTWNLYQSLCILGAKVTVLRNNELTSADFPNLRIRNLIISPGPGHPTTDSGVSNEAIKYFAGRVPVLGVCMGLECLVQSYGGTIEYAGEIMHGKTSPIRHDGRGCFRDVAQGIQSTRYHSLSAHRTTLPPALAITATTSESGVIMGVRHRELTLEAVQYHPESIMSEGGDALLRNFLDLQGGTWAENPTSKVLDPTLHPFSPDGPHRAPTILDKIYAQRIKDVELAKSTPGTTKEDLTTFLSMQLAPPLVPLVARLKARAPAPALMAEIKRASPSKGPIAMHTNAAQQALTYALAGASVISVLTEPTWFKGTLLDMRLAREAVATLTDRPAILRKDFIVDEYQICEARLWGADTVLLIVAMLPADRLRALYLFSLSLGMEPLVEVNNAEEMRTALRLGAKVIGVNNRNLHDFNVDMGTTSRLADMVADSDVILCALSGISGRADVVTYMGQGVGAVLVGESLMRASDPAHFIRTLLDLPPALTPRGGGTKPLVKICGIRSVEDAEVAAEAGADFVGVILVPGSKRCVDLSVVKDISSALRARRSSTTTTSQGPAVNGTTSHTPASNSTATAWFSSQARTLPSARPLLVGVFQDQPLSYIVQACGTAGLDIVQLHGHEPVEWSRWIPVPVIRAFHLRTKEPNQANGQELEAVDGTEEPAHDHAKDVDASGPTGLEDIARPGFHKYILLDAIKPGATSKLSGGAGVPVDWDLARAVADAGEIGRGRLPIILAGGLDAGNVREAVEKVVPWAVDVSGGVETDGAKDHAKIREFIKAAKGV